MFDTQSLRAEVAALLASARASAGAREGRAEDWVAAATECQRLLNAVSALQTYVVATVAATRTYEDEDGLLQTRFGNPEDPRIDAAALLSGPLGLSDAAAQAKVFHSVRLVHQLPEVLQAAADGQVDDFRARIVSEELYDASGEVVREVLPTITAHLTSGRCDTPMRLRGRIRKALYAVDPDSVRRRAKRAQTDRELRCWAAEAGVDQWAMRLPSEVSSSAWLAVDTLAQQLKRDGAADTIDQARADALVQLVMKNANVTYQVILTRPAATPLGPQVDPLSQAAPLQRGPGLSHRAESVRRSGVVAVTGLGRTQPTEVGAEWLANVSAQAEVVERDCHPVTGMLLPDGDLACSGYRPGVRLTAYVKARDGRCRFPGCSVNARFCDLDHTVPWPLGPTSPANLLTLCRRHHRIKQQTGWRVRLREDGSALWVDPTGRRRVTWPVDHLGVTDPDLRALPPGPPDPPEPVPLEGDDRAPFHPGRAAVEHALLRAGLPLRHRCVREGWPRLLVLHADEVSTPSTAPARPTRANTEPPPF